MALSYGYFPNEFLGPVVAAEAAAERQFRSIAGTLDSSDYDNRLELQRAAREYVSTLVLAFGRQACAAVRAGKLAPHRVAGFVEEFERAASTHAYFHLQLKGLWSGSEYFHDDVIPKIHLSRGWLEHLEERENVLGMPTQATVPPLTWSDIEIRFVSDHRFQVVVRGKLQAPQNYADAGFGDGRSGNPKVAWDTLRTLAESGGVIVSTEEVTEWPKLEKRMQEIRKWLKARFTLDADPLPYVNGGYRAQFKIRLSASYEH